MTPHRRAVLAAGASAFGALAAGCGPGPDAARAEEGRRGAVPALRALAPFPVGTAVSTARIADPAWVDLATRQCGQLTPEWEMKMEAILRDDGGFDFSRADRLAAFAQARGLRLFGHTLVWHAQAPPALQRLDGDPTAFGRAVDNYVTAAVGRYRGRVVGWDVVNEPVAEDGRGLRDSLYSRNLGAEDYALRAFQVAREADPDAVLLVNDYNLEALPAKRATFLRLVERLLARGAPIGGLGTQSHLDLDLAAGAVRDAMRDLAGLGLPIHVSELDVSVRGRRFDLRPRSDRLAAQARRYGETARAFLDLPPAQRFAFTTWGLRDRDSWLTRPDRPGGGQDAPLPFDDGGGPKPAFWSLAETLQGGARPASTPRG